MTDDERSWIGRDAPPFDSVLPAQGPLDRERFSGRPIVLGLMRRSPSAGCDQELSALRAELRGLGATLLLLSPSGLFCFRPDDELLLLADEGELALAEVARVFDAYEATAESDALFLIDDENRVRFVARLGWDGDLPALGVALSHAGKLLLSLPTGEDETGGFAQAAFGLLSRRELLVASLAAAFVVMLEGCEKPAARAPAPASSIASPSATGDTVKVALDVNGQLRELVLEPRVTLLDALRERLGLTGTKKGCDQGQCGACTVLVGERRIKSCLTLAVMVEGSKVVTIEGLSNGETLHPLQAAFIAEDAFQCGYCTPGQIMSAAGLVLEKRARTDAEIQEQMSGNLCRCGAYPNIVRALRRVIGEA